MTENAKPTPTLAGKAVRYAAVLMAVCLVSATGVSLMFVSSRERIKENEQKAFQEKLADVFGEAANPSPLGDYPEGTDAQYRVYAAETGSGIRYAAMGSAQGYQSKITVLVSVDAQESGVPLGDDAIIFRLAVVSSNETPGLGENMRKVEADVSLWGAIFGRGKGTGSVKKRPVFQEQFSGKRLSDLVVEKEANTDKIFPVTGATITSKAVTAAARNAVERIMEKTRECYGAS